MTSDRESGVELCRILAMLLVMIVHASFKSLGVPTLAEVTNSSISSFLRFHSQSMSIICVNVFILISGWFSIKPKVKRIAEFIIQIWFWYILMSFSVKLLGLSHPHMGGVFYWVKGLLFTNDWFIKSYITLYALSPILNIFAENAKRRDFELILLVFFFLQTLYGFVFNSKWYDLGYSPMSFAGLYLLSRYLRLYTPNWITLSKWCDIGLYFVLTFAITIITMSLIANGINVNKRLYVYSEPLVILASVYFLIFFTKIHFKSMMVNWIATSSFAAYLLHFNPNFKYFYFATIQKWFINESWMTFIVYTATFILMLFLLAILIDKIRHSCWVICLVMFSKTNKL